MMHRTPRTPALIALTILMATALSGVALAVPKVTAAGVTNPVAYELKSLQTTHFYAVVDQPVWAVLTVSNGSGVEVARVFDGPVNVVGKTFWFPAWNGKTNGGRCLPTSLGYVWNLRVTRGGQAATRHGIVGITRTFFSAQGQLEAQPGPTNGPVWGPYMVAGTAKAYLTTVSISPVSVQVWLHNDRVGLDTESVFSWHGVQNGAGVDPEVTLAPPAWRFSRGKRVLQLETSDRLWFRLTLIQ